MSFILKITLAIAFLFIFALGTFVAVKDVSIPQETVTKTIPNEVVIDD